MYGALRLRIIGRYVKRVFHSKHYFCNIFGINCYNMYDTEKNYRQCCYLPAV